MEENHLHEYRKERSSLSKNFLLVLSTSFLLFIFFLLITVTTAWYFRADIFRYFADEYLAENSQSAVMNTFSQEYAVVNAVKLANPAVVSVVLTRDVPTFEYSPRANPWRDLFPGLPDFFFDNSPEYRQNGTERREVGSGSGFLVSSTGLIVTNKHVVDAENVEYTVFTNDGKKHSAVVVDRDPLLDIAFLKIESDRKAILPIPLNEEEDNDPPFSRGIGGYPYLPLGDSDMLEVGQSVIAIGNALGEFDNTVSVGVVSGLSRSIIAGSVSGAREVLDEVIQTDAAINPGNSGGPLLDLAGRVIGVNVAVAQGSQGVGFALPINAVKGAIESVESEGRIIRPYLGLRYVVIDGELKERNNLSVDYGVLVRPGANTGEPAVISGGPADKAGLLENDIILEINGEKIDRDHTLASLIRKRKVGDQVSLRIMREGKERTIEVTLEEARN
ncbi:MAG TPA: trypsin-like peptidase domain-containing protein [Candidatus Paceibacterota bacterium]|nr:trypsin-like peptidase domain-containing protein [Candidatus Paceibacterota bacterium]